jgi:hypothetical protein
MSAPPRPTLRTSLTSALLVSTCLTSTARADDVAPPTGVGAPARPTSEVKVGEPGRSAAEDEPSAPWVFVVVGGVALSAGIALGTWSVIEHRRARELSGPGRDSRLDAQEQAEYDDAIALRDDLRIGSGVAAATALGLFVTGGVLFALDELDDAPAPAPTARLVPAVSPGFAGGVFSLRF